MPLVEIKNLRVSFAQQDGVVQAVRGVSLHLDEGESLGIVGESGSGKSVTCMALMRLLGGSAKITADTMMLDGVDVINAGDRDVTALRGKVAAMIFQDPMAAFDPVFTIGQQIVETIRTHRRVSKIEAQAEAEKLLQRVEIKNARDVLGYYPHQLSGGMLQRAMIAVALSCRPKVLIADEPTTALDVTIQAQILQLIKQLQAELGMALIMITHDLGVIAEMADRVVVMYAGEVMEEGSVDQIFASPQHEYTRSLLATMKAGEVGAEEPDKIAIDETVPALELRSLSKVFSVRRRGKIFGRYIDHHAVRRVDLVLPKRSIVGLVGESGSGKSSTGMMAMRLLEPTSGQILVEGNDISQLDGTELKSFRQRMQFVFQDSFSALDPMMTLAQIVAEPLHIHRVGTPRERTEAALNWLERVGLDRSFGNRYPHELSGGQRQRVAIARALILRPAVLIADEPTSALDVSIKAQILRLLKELQEEMGLSILFISHDLSVVRSLTDSVAVMYRGRVVEQGATKLVFTNPLHPYTRALLDAIPVTDPQARRIRTFMTPEDIERDTPRLAARLLRHGAAPSEERQMVHVAPDHQVEAIVTH